MVHLVIGSDGKIGKALFDELQVRGHSVIGTTRKNDGRPYLDVANPGEIPKSDVAYICACVIRKNDEIEPPDERAVNVDGTLKVVGKVLEQGGFPVFLSSTYVESITDAYATMKKEVEAEMLKVDGAIARLGGVVPENMADCVNFIIDIGVNRKRGLSRWAGK